MVEKFNNPTEAYTGCRLFEEAQKAGIDIKFVGVNDTTVSPKGLMNDGEILAPRDFAIIRYRWSRAEGLAKRIYNPFEPSEIFVNKLEQIKRIKSDVMLIPKYLSGTADIDYAVLTDSLGSPFVAKGLESSKGAQIYLIKSREDYNRLKHDWPEDKEWLFEEFIGTSFGRDIRVFSIRGEVIACMLRKSQGDFRANVALGASTELFETTPEIRQIAREVYEQTGLDFVGIDLLFGKDKFYFCEINTRAGIKGLEKATGVNVARKMIETVISDFEVGL